ncbi:glycosyltransferase 87 family protein [Ornithinimicrobium sp. CNJ-824]|uniref:glycosyltransferase 87 family protein n=1 Tax=Ornithinimicrobium sp. CNJ-824 TaxID=1904966 RepID=UPI0009F91626|nr:glycosyltransferase 87 family protein [Ornithinimicrobium sp. CNJ-824]
MTAVPPREGRRRDVPWRVPSWRDPVVARATGVVGGPLGRHGVVGRRGLAGVAAALVVLGAGMLALGVWQKGHCLLKGWSTPDQFWRACYSDVPVVHVSSPLADGLLPWSGEVPSTQPPLPGLVLWLLARVSPQAGTGLGAQQGVFVAWALLATALLAIGVMAAVALLPRSPWRAAHLAVSPVLVTLALVSVDLLGVVLTLVALWAWQRRHPWLAGALLGWAVLVRPFPLLVLLALVLVARREGHLLRAAQAVVGAALGALLLLVPLVAVEPQALTAAEQWWSQGAGYGAVQMLPRLAGFPLGTTASTWVAVAGWVAAVALAVVLARRPRWGLVQVAAATTAVVALTAPSLSVQSGLWVLPLLVLSARPWWEHLVWAGVETLHFVATWLHIAFDSDPGRGLPPLAYAVVVLLRAAAWGWLLWRITDERATTRTARAWSPPAARSGPVPAAATPPPAG